MKNWIELTNGIVTTTGSGDTIPDGAIEVESNDLQRLGKMWDHTINDVIPDNPDDIKAREQAADIIAKAKVAHEEMQLIPFMSADELDAVRREYPDYGKKEQVLIPTIKT